MQIPSTPHNDIARIPQGPQHAGRAAAAGKGPDVQAERLRPSASWGVGSNADTPSVTRQERLDAASGRINDRLANMLNDKELTADQREALEGAGSEFTALVDRISNALDEGGLQSKGKLRKAYSFAINALRDNVRSALQMDGPEKDKPAAAIDDMQKVKPKPSDDMKTKPVEQPSVPGQADLAELDQFRSSMDDRLDNLRSVNDFDKDQLGALNDAHEQFESIMSRVQYGLENGTLSDDQVNQGYKYALAGLRSDVHSILGADQSDDKPADPMGNVKSKPSDDGMKTITKVGDAEMPDKPESESMLDARLQSAFDRVDSRLTSMITGGNNAASELKGLQAEFGQVFERLQNALENGFNEKGVGDAFNSILDGLRHDVMDAQDQASASKEPMIYTEGAVALHLKGDQGTTGINTIG
ncbi:MAG: hypothetical protein ACI841_003262 [Planctomycetota bacterium]|jgi:hypothetical protein